MNNKLQLLLNLHQILFMIKKHFRSFAIAIIIFVLSTTESNNLKSPGFLDIPHLDKVIHFCMYFTLSISLLYENNRFSEKFRNVYISGLISLTYSILIEVFQNVFTKTRSAEVTDVLFNALGIVMATGIWKYHSIHKKNRLNRNDL